MKGILHSQSSHAVVFCWMKNQNRTSSVTQFINEAYKASVPLTTTYEEIINLNFIIVGYADREILISEGKMNADVGNINLYII